MIYLEKKYLQEIVEHCKGEYPKESCGIIAGKEKRVTKIYRMKNVSENPEICYFMEPKEQIKIFKEMRQLETELIGIYHSHSNSPAYPSQRDIDLAHYAEASYIIISLKDFNNPEVRAFKIKDGEIEEEKIIISEIK